MTESLIDVRDMAIVHKTFRQAYTESAQLVRANPIPSAGRVQFLADHIDFGLGMLHHHHEAEDELLYPLLLERVPDEAESTESIDGEHAVINTSVNDAEAACAAWRADPTAESASALADALDHVNEVMTPHLDHEEQVIVPLAARTLTQAEWDEIGERARAGIPKTHLAAAFGMVTEPLTPEEATLMKSGLPAPVRLLYPILIDRPWKRYADKLRHGT